MDRPPQYPGFPPNPYPNQRPSPAIPMPQANPFYQSRQPLRPEQNINPFYLKHDQKATGSEDFDPYRAQGPSYDGMQSPQFPQPVVRPARTKDHYHEEGTLWDSDDSEDSSSDEDEDDKDAKKAKEEAKIALWTKLPPPSHPERLPKLTLPIIIPQRRPGTKMRGFARVYPPILETKGIPVAEFLSFLKNYHKEMSISPAVTAINLGILAIGFVPAWEAAVATAVAQTLVSTAAGFNSYFKADKFMKKANEELFRPRGLLCTVVNFNPREAGSEIKLGKVDIAPFFDVVAPRMRNRIDKAESVVLPESAPLVYPPRGIDPNANFAKRALKNFDKWRDNGAANDFHHFYPKANLAASVDPNALPPQPSAGPSTMDRVKTGADIATTVLFSPISSLGAVVRGKDPRQTAMAKAKRNLRKKIVDFSKKRKLAANTLYLLIVQDTTQDEQLPVEKF